MVEQRFERGVGRSHYTESNLIFLASVMRAYRAKHRLDRRTLGAICGLGEYEIVVLEHGKIYTFWSASLDSPIARVIRVVLKESPSCAKPKVVPTLQIYGWMSPKCAKPKLPIGVPYTPAYRHIISFAAVSSMMSATKRPET